VSRDFGLRHIDRETFDRLTSSDSTQVVERPDWPDIPRKMEDAAQAVRQVWCWTNSEGEGVLEVIREHRQDGSTAWKRDRWYLIETVEGGTFITRKPDKDIEGGSHHSSSLPPWPIRE